MPKVAKLQKPRSGWQRVKAAGLHSFQLALTTEQREIFRQAAAADGRSVTQFLIHHGLAAAEKFLKKS